MTGRGTTGDSHTRLVELADELYALSPGDFTAARDSLSKEVKAGDPALAARIKGLRKPALAAWVVNLLVRQESEQIDQVLAMADALREAQAGADGEELRTLTRQRRQLTAALTTRARELAAEQGQRVTTPVADAVEASLTAALIDAEAGRALRSGLLIAPLSATGVDAAQIAPALAVPEALGYRATSREALVPAPPVLSVVADEPRDPAVELAEQIAHAEHELAIAADELAAASAVHTNLTGRWEATQAESLQVQAELEELARRAAELEEHAEEIDLRLAELGRQRDAASAEEADARAEWQQAHQRLDDLR